MAHSEATFEDVIGLAQQWRFGLEGGRPSTVGRGPLYTMIAMLTNDDTDSFHTVLLARVKAILAQHSGNQVKRVGLHSPMDVVPCLWLMTTWIVWIVCKVRRVDPLVDFVAPTLLKPTGMFGLTHLDRGCPSMMGWLQLAATASALVDWALIVDGIVSSDNTLVVPWLKRGRERCWVECALGKETVAVAPALLAFSTTEVRCMVPSDENPIRLLMRDRIDGSRTVGIFTSTERAAKARTDRVKKATDTTPDPFEVHGRKGLREAVIMAPTNNDGRPSKDQWRAIVSITLALTRLPSEVCLDLCGMRSDDDPCDLDVLRQRMDELMDDMAERRLYRQRALDKVEYSLTNLESGDDTDPLTLAIRTVFKDG